MLPTSLHAQKNVNSLLNEAEQKKSDFEFIQAIDLYKKVLKEESSNQWALEGLVELYLYKYEIFDSAAMYIEKRIQHMPKDTNYLTFFDYANCLRMQEKPIEAIKYYNLFKSYSGSIKRYSKFLPEVEKQLNACRNSVKNKTIKSETSDFEVSNMDFFVNSIDPEYTPVFIEDENLLLFNARYKDFESEEITKDNKYYENIYYYDIEESVSSSYNPDIDQESHHAVVGKRYDSDTILIFNKNKLYVTTLNQNRLKKGDPLPKELSNFYFQPHGAFSDRGNTFVFSAMIKKEANGGNLDIYISHKKNGTWSEPTPISVLINSSQNEDSPYLSRDGKTLYFSSKGHNSSGGYDFYKSELVDGNWTSPENLGYPMNSAGDDIYLIFSEDEKKGFFASNRNGGFGGMDIYSFEVNKIKLSGFVIDKDGNKLENAKLTFTNLSDESEIEYITDASGEYEFNVEPGIKYQLKGSKDDYFPNNSSFFQEDASENIRQNFILEKDPGLSLSMVITDKESNTPIDAAQIVYINNMTGVSSTHTTDANGQFLKPQTDKKIGDRGSYNLTISKEGYLAKTVTYNVHFKEQGIYSVSDSLNLSLEKVAIGQDISKIVDIQPIYFDVNKATIKPASAIELDKVVTVMNDNPNMVIELGSHTDSRGSAKSNAALSERRAFASAEYIKSRISHPERIEGKGYGESKLVNECADGVKCSPEQHQENRRTEFIIVKM